MSLRKAAQQALEALCLPCDRWNRRQTEIINASIATLRTALSDTQDWDEIEALRASLREHMAEIHRLRAAGRQALEALEEYQQKGAPFMSCDAAVNVLRAALEPVTDYHGLEQARAVVISNLLAHFGITSADSDVNVAYLHKQLDDFLTASIGCNKESDNLSLPLKIETCEYPWCLSPSGCGRQCPAFPRDQSAITGETSDVPETNFGNIAQAVNSKEADPTSQESRQVEPVAWMVYTLDGQSAFVTDNPADFTRDHRALPLYTAPPKREPMTDEQITDLFHGNNDQWWRVDHSEFCSIARAVERAHYIGSEE